MKTKLLIFFFSLLFVLPVMAKDERPQPLIMLSQEEIFQRTRTINNELFEYQIQEKESLGTILHQLGIGPLWGPNGYVKKIENLNHENLKLWGQRLKKGQWLKIPYPLESVMSSLADASGPKSMAMENASIQPAYLEENIQVIGADSLDKAPVNNQQVPQSLVEAEHVDSSRDIPARTIFLKMEKVSDAKTYQIQVKDRKKTWSDPYFLTTSREKIRFRATPGEYLLRTRSIDQNGNGGAWLPWVDFKVPFKYILSVSPASGTIVEPKGNRDERITFEWPQIKGSIAYRFKLFDQDKNLIKHVVTKQNWLLQIVEVNKSYSWSVQPLKTMNDPAEDMTTPHLLTISSPNPELIPVHLKVAGNAVAEKYQFELVKLRSDSETSEPTIYDSKPPEFMARLSPGQYELRVRTLFEDQMSSGWSSPHLFNVPIPQPSAKSATNDATVDSTDDIQSAVELKWQDSKWAERYQVVITNKDGQIKSSNVVKSSRMIASLPHDNSYGWTVVALAPKEPEKNPEDIIRKSNTDIHTFKINKYIPLQLGSSEEPSQLYGWSRFLFSQASYKNQNYDNNNRTQQDLFASTGEFGAGYWHRKSSLGLLGLTSVSSINVNGTKLIYQQHSLLFGYRFKLSDQKRLRLWLGPSMKETPEVQVSAITRSTELEKISTVGPYFLAAFHDAFGEKWGYQAGAGAFQGMQGLKTPNGLSQDNYLSYFWSLSLSYRASDWLSVLGGYTFQEDRAGYKSTDGRSNDVNLSGNYFSLNLIFGLTEAQK